ncbi:methionyl-tRNA formyltransferase [Pseudohongiella nitratireducens]|uniref:Methionyl-tRNA formyltransferase n=1 Tax=Pseudohongiella nitratireducens TaxID=1768907 RepID=A0A917LW61_9GAMM|nr:methionyl-tRNA formyltransferase [Pseudohongiella nitratireducens]MDF1623971.1 methionyl-tRNA formyltransferase [Pseudohongiella nitratireducens]GGG59075.1 methionyl-tRNA formyltransferase [Pseudohongiella nitratireducens]
MANSLRLIFAGTPDFAAQHLEALLSAGHQVCAVYTQPDRATGRGKKLKPTPVKAVAESHGLPVCQPASLKDESELARLREWQADLMIVVAYGLILPQTVLDTPRLGCLNVHASILPRWRGAAPIERAILAGDTESGVTIMQMDAGLDTGDMLYTKATPITPNDNRETLEAKLLHLGQESLLYTLANLDLLKSQAREQNDELSTYARKLDKQEAAINWADPSAIIDRQIRASIGRNPAYTFMDDLRIRVLAAVCEQDAPENNIEPGTIISISRNGKKVESVDVACGEGLLRIKQLQLPGKNAMSVHDVLNARQQAFEPGKQFSNLA